MKYKSLIFRLICVLFLQTMMLESASYCAFFNQTKHHEYNFLSNFHENPVVSPYGTFKCSEGLYQYLKFKYLKDESLLETFKNARGEEAWTLSRELASKTDPNWDRVAAMRETLLYKFNDKTLEKQLLATDDAYLVENSPAGHDSFWADNGDGTGKNALGHQLMEIRQKLGGKGIVPVPEILNTLYTKRCARCPNPCHFTNQSLVYNYCDGHMPRQLKLGKVSTQIQLSDIPDGTGRFLYFNLNDMPEFVEEAAFLIAERIKELGLKNPFFVTPEASTIAVAHLLRTKYNIDGIILSKRQKPNDVDTYCEDYCAITSLDKKTLYLEKSIDLKNKDIVIFDNVCTTGETLRAVYKLLCQSGADTQRIAESIVLFTEGEERSTLSIADGLELKIHSFEHIPIYSSDPSIDNAQYRLFSACNLPTSYGLINFCVFKHRTLGTEAIVCVSPLTLKDETRNNIPVRIHDACITSETFHSIKCDCQLQLNKAMEYIAEYGGMVIYLKQEGRGIGLANKIAAYNLQETQHLDTVQANRSLGLPDDMREYFVVRDILNHFGVKSIMLITNNPRKIECLERLGIKIGGRIPCIVKPESWQMQKYMKDKAEQMGHMIPTEKLTKDRKFNGTFEDEKVLE